MLIEKITFEMLALGLTLKVTQGHQNCLYSTNIIVSSVRDFA